MRLLIVAIVCLIQTQSVFAWNALGHRLIAEIAYCHLTDHAKAVVNRYNHALDTAYKPQSFADASVWLDTLRRQDVNWFNTFHYINIYFSEDGTSLPETPSQNAVWAIREAKEVLKSKSSSEFDKGMSLRVLLHVVGDLHQPLHAASQVSTNLPEGDRGGLLVALGPNRTGKNLHQYWDNGAGFLRKRLKSFQIKQTAIELEKRWPCERSLDLNPRHWAEESHRTAIKEAYSIVSGSIPNKEYQKNTQRIVEKRLVLAGCRLASLLNQTV